MMVFLDLSAVFNSIDHSILFRRLSSESDASVSWLRSYLRGRICGVKSASELSEPQPLDYGVPQGSVIGPQLFTMYTHPMANVIKKHKGVSYHSYADDIQLYIAINPRDADAVEAGLSSLSACIADLQKWMLHNMLKLNCDKSQFMVVTNPSTWHLLSNVSIQIENAVITPSNTVRNLGVEFHHVSALCRSLHFHLCNLGRIRRYIDNATCKQAVRAVVTSRLDYANALLQGISSS